MLNQFQAYLVQKGYIKKDIKNFQFPVIRQQLLTMLGELPKYAKKKIIPSSN